MWWEEKYEIKLHPKDITGLEMADGLEVEPGKRLHQSALPEYMH